MKKTFDAVAFQRKRRQKLSQEYRRNRKYFLKKLYDKLAQVSKN